MTKAQREAAQTAQTAPAAPATDPDGEATEPTLPPPQQLSVAQRRRLGRALRKSVPRVAHAAWRAPADRPDPVAVLEAQAAGRLPDLVPVRYGRMLASPFAFFRGAAAVMAMDLAALPRTPLQVQLCGDAHLANFGVFGSPERELVFDINDFDETLPGPFEWDLKRLVASFVLAARANGFRPAERRAAALAAAAAYRGAMRHFARMGTLAIWYAHVTVGDVTRVLDSPKARRSAAAWIRKARSNTSMRALDTLTRVVDGRRTIVEAPPLIERVPPELEGVDLADQIHRGLAAYRRTLAPDRRRLLDQYQPLDFARKVVGVGSVGTRCYILVLQGRSSADPLFLQLKEAQASVLEPHLGKSPFRDHGERVVVGQRWMQAASDIFLGWFRGPQGRDYYVRQLEDLKGSVPVEAVDPAGLLLYAHVCGRTLARAHARSGESVQIASYLGTGPRFDEALADFAEAYADQSERDHQALVAAHRSGRIQAVLGK
jgi:uncharacterized protein (DUF2252 family)